MPLRFDNVLIVDDIRFEINGKWILIGYYAGDIVISDFPASFSFQVMVGMEGLARGVHEITIRAVAGENICQFSGNIEILNEFKAVIPSPKLAMMFPEPTTLRIECSVDGSDPVILIEKNVIHSMG